MFSIFSKKKGPTVTDLVWIHTADCRAAIGTWLNNNPQGHVLTWFDEEVKVIKAAVPAHADCVMQAQQATKADIGQQPVLFAGHYPLRETEIEVGEQLELSKMLVYAALDAPLFLQFGGQKIIDLMRQMGMKEHESVENGLITSAIQKAQDKLKDKAGQEITATSETEWLRLNL